MERVEQLKLFFLFSLVFFNENILETMGALFIKMALLFIKTVLSPSMKDSPKIKPILYASSLNDLPSIPYAIISIPPIRSVLAK